MHVTHLWNQSSLLAVSSAPPFRSGSGKPSSLRLERVARRSEQRHQSAHT